MPWVGGEEVSGYMEVKHLHGTTGYETKERQAIGHECLPCDGSEEQCPMFFMYSDDRCESATVRLSRCQNMMRRGKGQYAVAHVNAHFLGKRGPPQTGFVVCCKHCNDDKKIRKFGGVQYVDEDDFIPSKYGYRRPSRGADYTISHQIRQNPYDDWAVELYSSRETQWYYVQVDEYNEDDDDEEEEEDEDEDEDEEEEDDDDAPSVGDRVRIIDASDEETGPFVGRTGRLLEDDGTCRPYLVEISGDSTNYWFCRGELETVDEDEESDNPDDDSSSSDSDEDTDDGRKCAVCRQRTSRGHFSFNQWSKGSGYSKCRSCLH